MSTPTPRPILLVIGPHRSGTSVLTQMLSTMGFDLGRTLMPPSFDNPRGFWENEKIVDRHDQLLSDLGRDWSTAGALPEGWIDSDAARSALTDICDILNSDFNDHDPSLIKDPRLCSLAPLWDAVGERLSRPIHKVLITRQPDHIGQSIARRDGVSEKTGTAITLSYLEQATALPWSEGTQALSYEALMKWPLEGRLDECLKILSHAANLRLPVPDANAEKQLLSLLRPNDRKAPITEVAKAYAKITPSSLAPSVKALKQFTKTISDSGEFDEERAQMARGESLLPKEPTLITISRGQLAGLETDLDDALRDRDAFKDGVSEREKTLKSLRGSLTRAKRERAAFKDGVNEREAMLTALRADLETAERDRVAFKDGIEEREAKLTEIRLTLAEITREKDAFAAGIEERDRWISLLQTEIEDLKSIIAGLQTEAGDIRAELAELARIKEMQDVTISMEAARSKMVETELNAQVANLSERVAYYENAPLRSGLKSSAFALLRAIRRRFPLSEDRKLAIARKFTPLALALRPHRDDAPHQGGPHQGGQLDAPNAAIDFAFKESANPVISIIVPVYNEISQTIACLRSIYQQQVSVDYEVILADDCSPDPFHTALMDVPGLRYFRNEQNLHFLRNCNQNAAHARGDYLVFLNNDTIVKPGWMQTLYDSFFEHGNVGIVGSKLIFPDGKLQEAGGIIWEDASGWNWGRGQNPKHPLYNFVRDVDYVSGASFMIPKAIWDEVGGFSETLEKAYYEDTDLCFQLRQKGYRVLYQPASELIHIEGLSSGTDLGSGVKQYQIINQKTFQDRWAGALSGHWPNATTPLKASDRTRIGHVLYIDAVTPEPNNDSGSIDAVNAMRILQTLGYRVHFVPGSNFAYWGEATTDLQQMGIECIYHPFYSDLEAFIADRGDMFDYVVLSRPESADTFLDLVKDKLPSAKIIYNTVDLHFMRMERRAAEQSDPAVAAEAKDMKARELSYIDRSDAAIILSEVERDLLAQSEARRSKLWTIPLIREESRRLVTFEQTQDIAFIGGYRHPPNVDAADWLMAEIWPAIREALPGVTLHICGSHMPDRFKDYAADDVKIRGFIPDLDALLSGLRFTIAPLRFGAGLKGKVASSIGAGVPCIGTQIAFEGMASDGLGAIKLLARTPEDFAERAASLYHDAEQWTKISKAGVDYHNQHYAYTNVMKTYDDMLKAIRT